MADVKKLAPLIFKWEGGFVNDPRDHGGATNKGVTLATWQKCGYDKDGDHDIDAEDIRRLTLEDATLILKKYYWDRWQADRINSQAVANILVDWLWLSGKWGIIIPQRLLNISPQDGIVGPFTLSKLNAQEPRLFFAKVVKERLDFINGIVARDPAQQRFKQGWINRLNDFKYF